MNFTIVNTPNDIYNKQNYIRKIKQKEIRNLIPKVKIERKNN